MANSVDPGQTPRSTASDLGLHYFSQVCLSKYFITKTYLYNFNPLKPNFYIVKLGFKGVYIIFLISA